MSQPPQDPPHLRPVRSFVRREGRLTKAQKSALESLWPRYGVAMPATRLDFDELFGRSARRALEIGFGDGETLAAMAHAAPDWDFLGIEVHRPGVGHLMLALERLALSNVRVMAEDAVAVVVQALPMASLDRIQIYFPDPWPKKRHHKRRLINPTFTQQLAQRLKPGGQLHLATDWQPYAEQMLAVLQDCPLMANTSEGFSPRPAFRPLTKFERRGLRLEHKVHDLLFVRRPLSPQSALSL